MKKEKIQKLICGLKSIPLFLYVLQLWAEGSSLLNQIPNLTIKAKDSFSGEKFVVVFFMVFLILKRYRWSQQSYFDPGPRTNKTYSINTPLATGVFTTKERATVMNEVLDILPNYVEPNDYLFVYDKIPMIHFLTETRPYMYNSWPWIYDEVSFKKKLETAQKNRDALPVVLVQKFETIGEFSAPQLNYLATDIDETYFHNNAIAELMTEFLVENDYKIAWSNDYFNIYIR